MILTDEEVEERLKSESNLLNKVRVEIKRSDLKQEGDVKVPSEIKKLIAVIGHSGDDTQNEIANQFGISQATVSGIMRGLVGSRLDNELAEVVETTKEENKITSKEKTDAAHEAALDSLMAALHKTSVLLPADEMLTAKGASSIAKDMSAVVANLKKNTEEETGKSKVLVVLHGIERRKEAVYDFIEG